MINDDLFLHKCVVPDCRKFIEFDDEPWCFEHSPNSGSFFLEYSAKISAVNLSAEEVIEQLLVVFSQKIKDGQLPLPGTKDPEIISTLATAQVWLDARKDCFGDGATDYQLKSIDEMIQKFKTFAATHPTKQPGITRGLKWDGQPS